MISAAKNYPPRLLPLRLPRVCVAVTAADPTELVDKAESLIRDNSFLEFRLDYISKPALAFPKIKHFIETHPGTVIIATCRRVASGGKFRGSIASQLDILAKASASSIGSRSERCTFSMVAMRRASPPSNFRISTGTL